MCKTELIILVSQYSENLQMKGIMQMLTTIRIPGHTQLDKHFVLS